MPKISIVEFQNMVGAVVDANYGRNAGDERHVQNALEKAATIFNRVGLADVVSVREVPYNGSVRYQLCGVDEKGIAYTLTPKGIVFP